METFSTLLALCAGNSLVTGEFPAQRPVTWSFDIFFDLCLNKRLSKQSWSWWFERPLRSLWCHCNDLSMPYIRESVRRDMAVTWLLSWPWLPWRGQLIKCQVRCRIPWGCVLTCFERPLLHIPYRYTLTHWGWVTHICVSKITIIGSDNGLSPGLCQAIIWTNAEILLIWPLGTNLSGILIEINTFSFKKMHLKMSSGKWRPFVSASMC